MINKALFLVFGVLTATFVLGQKDNASSSSTFVSHNWDYLKVNASTKTGCFSGDCSDTGLHTSVIYNDANLRLVNSGRHGDYGLNGAGLEALWIANPSSSSAYLHMYKVNEGIFEKGYFVSGKSIKFNIDNEDTLSVATGSFGEYGVMSESILQGEIFYYTHGNRNQFVRFAGTYSYGVCTAGNVTLYGFVGNIDGEYPMTSGGIFGGLCVSGDCEHGAGIKLDYNAICSGRFKKGKLVEGTIQIYNTGDLTSSGYFKIDNYTINKYNGVTTYSGQFTPNNTTVSIGCKIESFYNVEPLDANKAGSTGYTSLSTDAKKWVDEWENTQAATKQKLAAERQKEYDDDRQLKTTNINAWYLKHPTEQPGYYPDSYYRQKAGYNNTNDGNSKPIQNGSICFCCHGLGTIAKYDAGNTYQSYDHGSKVGNPTQFRNIKCTCCNGSGH